MGNAYCSVALGRKTGLREKRGLKGQLFICPTVPTELSIGQWKRSRTQTLSVISVSMTGQLVASSAFIPSAPSISCFQVALSAESLHLHAGWTCFKTWMSRTRSQVTRKKANTFILHSIINSASCKVSSVKRCGKFCKKMCYFLSTKYTVSKRVLIGNKCFIPWQASDLLFTICDVYFM